MIESEINKRYCQSCGMPLRFDVEKYLGTNSDGSRSDEYCYYCLKDGKYIVDIPMSEMINIWINTPTSTMNMQVLLIRRRNLGTSSTNGYPI